MSSIRAAALASLVLSCPAAVADSAQAAFDLASTRFRHALRGKAAEVSRCWDGFRDEELGHHMALKVAIGAGGAVRVRRIGGEAYPEGVLGCLKAVVEQINIGPVGKPVTLSMITAGLRPMSPPPKD